MRLVTSGVPWPLTVQSLFKIGFYEDIAIQNLGWEDFLPNTSYLMHGDTWPCLRIQKVPDWLLLSGRRVGKSTGSISGHVYRFLMVCYCQTLWRSTTTRTIYYNIHSHYCVIGLFWVDFACYYSKWRKMAFPKSESTRVDETTKT